MNIDTRQCIRSKFFVRKSAMDESLSDFQEIKHNCKGPKTAHKVTKTKARQVKKVKGQKDIRTALKGKNDLISYTKEFENVCKKSGIDVDSEQLQVAIALSKSLQTEVADDDTASKSLTTQGRVAKIRTTLQEYGFKVPETKITTKTWIKKHRKHYKLLNTTEEEKHQKIRNKYAQILLQTLDYKLSEVSICQYHTPIYNIATNLEYEFMKNNNIFYVHSLASFIEKSATIGSLLKNWAEIPGRPISPVLGENFTMDFSEIVCSQDELDIILSGPIKSAHKIFEAKTLEEAKDLDRSIPQVVFGSERNNEIVEVGGKVNKVDHDAGMTVDEHVYVTNNIVLTSPRKENIIDLVSNSTLTVREPYRSYSPDIFDDEVVCIMETPKQILSQDQKTIVFTEEGNSMDLTECANINFEKRESIFKNTTKINHDDFMEMTECAVTASQGIHDNVKKNVFTHSFNVKSVREMNNDVGGDSNYIAESPGYNLSQRHVDIVDHIISNNEEDSKSVVYKSPIECFELVKNASISNNGGDELCVEAPLDDIDLTQSSNEDENKLTGIDKEVSKYESMDLTQSSKSSVDISDLPQINLCNTLKCPMNPDDTIILNEEEYLGADGKVKNSIVTQVDQTFDLTQTAEEFIKPPINLMEKKTSKVCSQSFYEEFIHDHSDNNENNDYLKHCDENSYHNSSKESLDIDLTQTSDSSTENNGTPRITIEKMPESSSLGKKDDISIDYDEICEYVEYKDINTDNNCFDKDNSNILKYDSLKSQSYNDVEIVDSNNDIISNSSQHSVVFDLTDKELDYSLYKSRLDIPIANDNYDFEGIHIMDSNAKHGSLKKSLTPCVKNKNYTEESFLPELNLKKTEKVIQAKNRTDASSSSNKEHIMNQNSNIVPIVTPKNCEYIVKTDEVTPMLDYASLTTPQRNKELNKYGLKPFKRKRAIQILTHLYNQTHPVIESYLDDEHPSPSKKPKQDSPIPSQRTQSPRKPDRVYTNAKSPRKQDTIDNSKSPRHVSENDENMNSPTKKLSGTKENINAYEVTSHIPNIKSVDCDPDYWVFQKREKAKVHSCRVPLHIAFHNYVSSRRSLREAILKYEPVNIDVIHKDLVSYGHRYDPKDLLRFLDKKCITVKTTDNNARNKR